jgi:phytoene dehydrogenase-like protein
MTETVVIGGGLAGLVAARRLAAGGHDVTLCEREAAVGGRVRSVHRDGYTFDRGFQVLFTAYPAVRRELDLDALDLRSFAPGAVLARGDSRSVLADPIRDPMALTDALFNSEVTLLDKVRVLGLRRSLRRLDPADIWERPDEPVADYLRDRGFSEAFLANFAAPFYGGIALDRSLETSANVFRYVFKMLSEGQTAVPAEGMGAIPAQLAARAREAGARVRTEAPVGDLRPNGDAVTLDVDGETQTVDLAVVATDPVSAASLTDVSLPTDAVGCVTQHVSLPAGQRLRTGNRLLLNLEGTTPAHVAPMSAVASTYAPEGRQLLAATFLGVPDADDETLFEQVRAALATWYPAKSIGDLRLERTDRIPMAQPTQPPGFRSDRPPVDAPSGPVVLAGDYTQWASLQGAMESGRVAAATLLDEDGETDLTTQVA